MALYTDIVMDHFMNPRNVGSIENADGVGEVGNAKCGDIMKMYLKIKDDKIEDVKFETFGCGSAIASSSMATEMIKGKTIEEALNVTNKDVVDALGGLPRTSSTARYSPRRPSKSAVKDYYDKNGIAYDKEKSSLSARTASPAGWCEFSYGRVLTGVCGKFEKIEQTARKAMLCGRFSMSARHAPRRRVHATCQPYQNDLIEQRLHRLDRAARDMVRGGKLRV